MKTSNYQQIWTLLTGLYVAGLIGLTHFDFITPAIGLFFISMPIALTLALLVHFQNRRELYFRDDTLVLGWKYDNDGIQKNSFKKKELSLLEIKNVEIHIEPITIFKFIVPTFRWRVILDTNQGKISQRLLFGSKESMRATPNQITTETLTQSIAIVALAQLATVLDKSLGIIKFIQILIQRKISFTVFLDRRLKDDPGYIAPVIGQLFELSKKEGFVVQTK